MPRAAKILASILTLLLLVGGLGYAYLQQEAALSLARSQRGQASAELQRLERALAETRSQLMERDLALDEARERVSGLERDNARLQREKETITHSQETLETEMRRVLQSKDITISELQGKLTVDILDRVLFDSGEATLKPEGQQVLRRVAEVLAQYPKRQIHVIGHTDNVPIRAAARDRYPSNWELSTARATAAVRFLSEQAGVDPGRLGAVGYGEFRPVADNATAEGRARNRRIALVVLSEELVGSDAVPTVRDLAPPAASTNAPPATGETTPAATPAPTPTTSEPAAAPAASAAAPASPGETNSPPDSPPPPP